MAFICCSRKASTVSIEGITSKATGAAASRFFSLWRIESRASRLRTSAWRVRIWGAGDIHSGGWWRWQNLAICWASAITRERVPGLGARETGLGARETGLDEVVDLSRVDDTNLVALLMEEGGKRFAVDAGGFQAGVELMRSLMGEPVGQ